jgi:hypothetical protein
MMTDILYVGVASCHTPHRCSSWEVEDRNPPPWSRELGSCLSFPRRARASKKSSEKSTFQDNFYKDRWSNTTTTLVCGDSGDWYQILLPVAQIHSSGVRCCLGYSRHSRISWYQSPESRIDANQKRHDAGPQLHCPITAFPKISSLNPLNPLNHDHRLILSQI